MERIPGIECEEAEAGKPPRLGRWHDQEVGAEDERPDLSQKTKAIPPPSRTSG